MLNQLISCKRYNRLIRLASLLLAGLFVFYYYGIIVHAKVTADGDMYFNLGVQRPRLELDFFGNYIRDGSDRESSIPYTYRGNSYMYFNIGKRDGTYPFVNGIITKRVTVTLLSQVSGATDYRLPYVSVVDSSLPEGVTAYVSALTGDGNEFYFDVNLAFDNLEIAYPRRGGITLQFETTVFADAVQFGSSYGRLYYNTSVASDWTGTLRFGDTVYAMDLGKAVFYDVLNSQVLELQGIFSKLNTGFSQLHNDIVITLSDSLNGWFSVNHSDLQTLHTDNTTFLARFNTVYTDLRTRLGTWFNRQHDDLVNLLETTTEGYDNTEGNNINNDLSGSLGNMEQMESQVSTNASDVLSGYNPSSALSFEKGLVSGMSFVNSVANSFFKISGKFAIAVSVRYTLVFLVIVVGIWRFRNK